ncbi:MAG: c-type cytochrome [Candidatus Nitrospinota bacterium M3_3B_026]
MRIIKFVLFVAIAYLLLKFGVPFVGSKLHHGTWPVIPTSVMKMYMFFVVVGGLLVYTFSAEGYSGVIGPIADIYADPKKLPLRIVSIALVGALGAYVTYQYVKPTFEAPVELRSVHPAPPSSIKMWDKSFNLLALNNPLREDKENFDKYIEEGGIVYYQNCFYCHGDRMMGRGHYADAFNPRPANFVDVGTIAQLTEAFVFWRVGAGGPGLPSEGTPWLSAMPVWKDMLSEEEVWKVIMFLYWYTGHSPRAMEAPAEGGGGH